jgi:RimJ/RimL family protein N-acetyltransferase
MHLQIIDGKKYRFSDEDFLALAEIETHPKVVKWNIDASTSDKMEMYYLFKKAFESLPTQKNQIFLAARLNDKLVGFLGIRREQNRVGNLGVSVHPDYWKRGFGTVLVRAGIEEARKRRLIKIEAETLSTNRPMLRVAEKCGFKPEGARKTTIGREGKKGDVVKLGLILNENLKNGSG